MYRHEENNFEYSQQKIKYSSFNLIIKEKMRLIRFIFKKKKKIKISY